MNVVVCVKHVPDATADRGFNSSDQTVDRARVEGLLSELDEYAVEEALRLVEATGGEVTVLTVGPERAAEAVRKGLQMGADKGVHVQDEAIKGSDALATSLVLAKAVEKVGESSDVDVVLCGMASTDGSMGVLPAMLAERLDLPQATFASEVTLKGGVMRIRRAGDMAVQTIEVAGRLVLSVTDQCNEPRYPSFKGIMAAKKKPVETWSLADLGVEAGLAGLAASATAVESVVKRPPRTQGTVVTDDGDGAARLVEFLAGQKFIEAAMISQGAGSDE